MNVKIKVIILCSICSLLLIGGIIADNILGRSYLVEIKYDEVVKKFEKKEDFVLLVSQTNCSHCISYKPKLEEVANEYKLEVYYIDVDLLSNEERKTFESYVGFDGTPATIFIKEGTETTVANRINGNASKDKIEKKLKTNGFID